jgi:hypothetical protein
LTDNNGGPYFFFLYNPGYFLSMAFFAPDSAFFTPDGEVRRWIASTAAGPVSGFGLVTILGINFFFEAGTGLPVGILGAGFFIFGIT